MPAHSQTKRPTALDILVEDISDSLWVAGMGHNTLSALEIDPYLEFIRAGSIYWAKVMRIDSAINAAFLDLGNEIMGMLPASEVPDLKKGGRIGTKLRNGDFVMVQVKTARQPDLGATNPDAAKLSKMSMDIALPGRYLIYTPLSTRNRLSRRIRHTATRKQLTSMLAAIEDVNGCILRASAADTQTDILVREGKIQRTIWDSLQEFTSDTEPALLMLGPDALQRVLSDLAASAIATIQIANEERAEEARGWCELYAPEFITKIQDRKISGTRNGMGLFEAHDLLGQIEDLIRPYVLLHSGGLVTIEPTALGTMIDVNTASGGTPAKVNAESVTEIARHIRLRNLGGAILIDFAGLNSKAEQSRLSKALKAAFEQDPCTVELHGVTKLGLFEISRHRRTPTLIERVHLMQQDDE